MNRQWPTYSDTNNNFVYALPIKAIRQTVDGYAYASFDGNYEEQYLSSQFMTIFRPVVGGYLFNSASGELLYMSKAAFEAEYTAAGATVTNAETADKLSTARTITLTGAITGSASFDGSANVTIETTAGS